MKSMYRSALIGFVVIGLASCDGGGEAAAPQAAAAAAITGTNVRVLFDGGFLFVKHADGSMSAISPRHDSEHEAALTVMAPLSETAYPLKDWWVSIEGVASSGTMLPTNARVEQHADTCDEIPLDGPAANNLSWLPNLSELHPGARLNLSAAAMESRIALGAGALKVAKALGCWELRNASTRRKAQSLVYGPNAIEFLTSTTQSSIVLRFSPLEPGGGNEFTVEVPVTAGQEVVVEIGYPLIAGDGTQRDGEMVDFERHYHLVQGVAAADRYAPIAKIDHTKEGHGQFPGRECGSALFVE